jgi:hypothetical protein
MVKVDILVSVTVAVAVENWMAIAGLSVIVAFPVLQQARAASSSPQQKTLVLSQGVRATPPAGLSACF